MMSVLKLMILSAAAAVFSTETEHVTKRDGETVTLYVNKTTTGPIKDYLWTYGHYHPVHAITIVTNGEVIVVNGTRFGNRLHTRVENGSITISNLTTKDTGVFLAQILTETGSLTQSFNLTVQDNNVNPVITLEGNNVTLSSLAQQLKKGHKVIWTLGEDFSGKRIALWENFKIFIDDSFKDVLQLNPQNGSLSFIGVTKNLTGVYCVKVLKNKEPYTMIQYSIIVFEPVCEPHVSRDDSTTHPLSDGSCSIVCSEKNAPEVTLTWYSERMEINRTSNSDVSTNLTLPLKIQSQHEGNYSCVARNPADSKEVTVDSTQWCPPGHTNNVRVLTICLVAVSVAVLLVVVVAVVCLCKQICRNEATNCFCMRNMAQETPPQNEEVSEGSSEAEQEQQELLANT